MTYEIRSDEFWDPGQLRSEQVRVSEVCNVCRQCRDLCPAFVSLFKSIDERHRGVAGSLEVAELRRVVDLCFHCKQCLLECPYSPDRRHAHQVDFPRLMVRGRLVRARLEGVSIQDRFLSNRDLTGAIGSLTAPLSNWMGRSRLGRLGLEKVLGIDRARVLPTFARTPFERWFRKREKRLKKRAGGSGGRAALFVSCSVNWNRPEIGMSAVAVLAHHDVQIVVPDQRCCGMPYLQTGDLANAEENLRFNLGSFRRFVDEGYTIVVLQPSCGYFLNKEYPWLDDSHQARQMADAAVDIGGFLMSLHTSGRLDTRFAHSPGRVLYHEACHLRAQGRGPGSRDLLGLIPGAEVETVTGCGAAEGPWGLAREQPEDSCDPARRLLERSAEHRPDRLVTECASAGLQIGRGEGMRSHHPVELLREAYGLSLNL